MRYSNFLHVLAFTVSLVVANHHEKHAHRHSGMAKPFKADVGLHKRFSNARFTFYAAGLFVFVLGYRYIFRLTGHVVAEVPAEKPT